MSKEKNISKLAQAIQNSTTVPEAVVYSDTIKVVMVEGGKPKKARSRLIILSKYRIWLYKIRGSYKLEKDYPFLFITEIKGSDKDEFIFELECPAGNTTKNVTMVFKKDKDTKSMSEIIDNIWEGYCRITLYWPDDMTMKLTNVNVKNKLDIDEGACRGLINTLYAYTNLNGKEMKDILVDYFQNITTEGITNLNLAECPCIDVKTELCFDLLTLAYALRHNTYFRSLEMRSLDNKDANMMMSLVISGNRVMTKVVSTDNGDIPEILGEALQGNPNHNIQILQLSGNKFSPKSIKSFASGLQECPNCLRVLDLGNTKIDSTGAIGLLEAMIANTAMSLNLEEFNFSNNQLNPQASQVFVRWLSSIRKGNLKRLAVANTGVQLGFVMLEIGFLPIEYLDFSDNKVEKEFQSAFYLYCEVSKTLKTIRLAGTKMEKDMLLEILKKLFDNQNINEINIDISRNNLGPTLPNGMINVLKSANNLATLDISDNNIREQSGIEILKNLPSNIQRLIFNNNVGERPEASDFASTLAAFILSHPSCTSLSIQGSQGFEMKKEIIKFFAALDRNETLKELDVSGHQMGDTVFVVLCKNLWMNKGLRYINCDNNNISWSGYKAFQLALQRNPNISGYHFPELDLNIQRLQKFTKLVCEIDAQLSARRPLGVPLVSPNPFDFDLKWSPSHFSTNHTNFPSSSSSPSLTQSISSPNIPSLNTSQSTNSLNFQTAQPTSPHAKPTVNLNQFLSTKRQPPPKPATPPPGGRTRATRMSILSVGGHMAQSATGGNWDADSEDDGETEESEVQQLKSQKSSDNLAMEQVKIGKGGRVRLQAPLPEDSDSD